MPDILVRGLDAKVVARLKKKAKANGRSLQAEVKRLLEEAAQTETLDWESARQIADRIRRSLGPQSTDSANLLREDRDR